MRPARSGKEAPHPWIIGCRRICTISGRPSKRKSSGPDVLFLLTASLEYLG